MKSQVIWFVNTIEAIIALSVVHKIMAGGEHFKYCFLFSFTHTFSGKHVLFFIASSWMTVLKMFQLCDYFSYVLRLDRVLDNVI